MLPQAISFIYPQILLVVVDSLFLIQGCDGKCIQVVGSDNAKEITSLNYSTEWFRF